MGSRFSNIKKALHLLREKVFSSFRASVVFETKAILLSESPQEWDVPYLNMVVVGQTALSPEDLHARLVQIERLMGRDPSAPRWSPRVIDLDILAWGEEVIRNASLTIPHPELMKRSFLLHLMASLKPMWRYPVEETPYSHRTLSEILHAFPDFDSYHAHRYMPCPQMVGVVNVTPDSFTDGVMEVSQVLQKIQTLEQQGAAVIDIGGQSTRPGAVLISPEEEWQRVGLVLEALNELWGSRLAKPLVSLDSFQPEVVQKAFECFPIDWVNDVSGGRDMRLLKLVAEGKYSIVLTHSLGVPPSKKVILPHDREPIDVVYEWAEVKVAELEVLGIPKERIILDPGIGFGKSAYQNFSLLRDIGKLKVLGCDVLVGHSRKPFLKTASTQRDWETVGLSQYLTMQGVDYLRVHHVEAHQQALTAAALFGLEFGLHGFQTVGSSV